MGNFILKEALLATQTKKTVMMFCDMISLRGIISKCFEIKSFFEYLFYKPAEHSWNPPPGNKIDFYSFY